MLPLIDKRYLDITYKFEKEEDNSLINLNNRIIGTF